MVSWADEFCYYYSDKKLVKMQEYLKIQFHKFLLLIFLRTISILRNQKINKL